MKNIGLALALLAFVLLAFVAIGQRGASGKVGVKELQLNKVNKDEITRIELTLPPVKLVGTIDQGSSMPKATTHLVLEKRGDGWVVFDPANAKETFDAEASQVSMVLDAAASTTIGDLVSNKADKLASYQIDDENGQVVKMSTAKGTALELVFGRSAKGGGSSVRVPGSNDIFLTKSRLGIVTRKDLAAWRSKTLVAARGAEIVKVSTTLADGRRIVAEAQPAPPADGAATAKSEWKLVEPAAVPAGFRLDPTQVTRIGTSVGGLRAQELAPDGTTEEQAGLTGAHATVEVVLKDGKTLVLHIGKENDKKLFFARRDGDPQLYLLSNFSGKQLLRTLDDLRDLSLLDGKADDVERVTVTGSARVVVARDGDAWKLVEPKEPPAEFDVGQVASQVASLLRLKATRLALDAPGNAVAKAGPVVEVAFKGGKVQTVRFGGPAPNTDGPATGDSPPREFYAKGGVDDLLYVVSASQRNRYDKPLELFKKPEPPPGMNGGSIPGLDQLPPDVRKKLEEQLKNGAGAN